MFSVRGQRVSRVALASRRLISSSAVDNGLGVSELSLIAKAGSRFEPVPGVAHLVQKFAFKDTKVRSGLRLQRESELLGGSLSTSLGKENLVLTARFLREDLPYFVEALADTVSNPLYKQYQFNEEVVPLAQAEAKKLRADAGYVAVEGAYEAAFRTGLANPTVVSPESPVTLDTVIEYAGQAYKPDSLQLYGRNVVAADLEKFAGSDFAKLDNSSASLELQPAKYFSGESRVKSSGPEQAAVIAFPTDTKPCLDVLKYVLSGRTIKWSSSFGLLNDFNVKLDVVNAKFSDSSLFYIVLRGSSAAEVSGAAQGAVDALKEVAAGLDDELAQKAIATARFAAVEAEGSLQSVLTPSSDLSQVSASSISAAAKSLIEGKRVLSVVGQTYALPYADELF